MVAVKILHSELITERMQLKPDPTVQPGGCQIDAEMGTIKRDD
jgi:flagellar biosynthesis/type III secretory pathway protein FliH